MEKVQTSLRIDKSKLNEAKIILADLGINFTEAVNIFTSMVIIERGLPFDVKIPNKKTEQAMRDIRLKKNIKEVTINELKSEMEINEET